MGFPTLPTWEGLEDVASLHTELNLVRDRLNYLGAMPTVRALRTSTQSIPNLVPTTVQFNAADPFDTHAEHSPTVNNTRITIVEPGWRIFTAGIRFASNSVGLRGAVFNVNGVFDHYCPLQGYMPANGPTNLSLAMFRPFVVGDYIEVELYQSSGGALNIEADGDHSITMTSFMLHG